MFLYAHWPLEALEGTARVFWLRKALTNGKLKIENSAPSLTEIRKTIRKLLVQQDRWLFKASRKKRNNRRNSYLKREAIGSPRMVRDSSTAKTLPANSDQLPRCWLHRGPGAQPAKVKKITGSGGADGVRVFRAIGFGSQRRRGLPHVMFLPLVHRRPRRTRRSSSAAKPATSQSARE